jgi:LAGLIDADG endonuclease
MIRKFSMNNSINRFDKLDPNWITGFFDAEGCFTLIISKRSDNLKWRVTVSFEINLHIKDIEILNKVKNFFEVGTITTIVNRNLCVYRVTKN